MYKLVKKVKDKKDIVMIVNDLLQAKAFLKNGFVEVEYKQEEKKPTTQA